MKRKGCPRLEDYNTQHEHLLNEIHDLIQKIKAKLITQKNLRSLEKKNRHRRRCSRHRRRHGRLSVLIDGVPANIPKTVFNFCVNQLIAARWCDSTCLLDCDPWPFRQRFQFLLFPLSGPRTSPSGKALRQIVSNAYCDSAATWTKKCMARCAGPGTSTVLCWLV